MAVNLKQTERPEFWNERFSDSGYAYGVHANDFLRMICHQPATGDVLSLCEGEGRNAVYLAKLGFRVTAVDFSAVGLQKARDLAAREGVSITTIVADLSDFDLGVNCWDMVISVFAQPPGAIRQNIYRQLQYALRPGGSFILESKVVVDATAAERYPGAQVLVREIAPLSVTTAREQERQLNEGSYHKGMQRTVQILAIKSTEYSAHHSPNIPETKT